VDKTWYILHTLQVCVNGVLNRSRPRLACPRSCCLSVRELAERMHVRWILKRPFQLPRPPRTRRAKKKKRWSLASRFPTRAAWPRPNTGPSRGKPPRQEGSRRGRHRRKRPRATPASPPGHYHTLGLGGGPNTTLAEEKRHGSDPT
jgi:hypothetical protein